MDMAMAMLHCSSRLLLRVEHMVIELLLLHSRLLLHLAWVAMAVEILCLVVVLGTLGTWQQIVHMD